MTRFTRLPRLGTVPAGISHRKASWNSIYSRNLCSTFSNKCNRKALWRLVEILRERRKTRSCMERWRNLKRDLARAHLSREMTTFSSARCCGVSTVPGDDKSHFLFLTVAFQFPTGRMKYRECW